MHVRAAVVLVLTGCFVAPSFPCRQPSDGAPHDDFTDTSQGLCGAWGYQFGDVSSMSRGGGMLSIVVPVAEGGAGCSTMPVELTDVSFVAITAVAQSPTAYTELIACPPSTQCNIGFNILDGMLQFRHFDGSLAAGAPYDPVAMRWLALARKGSTMYGAYGRTPDEWIDFGSTPVDDGPVKMTLSAGSYGSNGGGTSTFEDFNVCP